MSTFFINPYDKDGYHRHTDKVWRVYAAFAPVTKAVSREGALTMVKIGITANVYDRMSVLRTACPFHIEVTLHRALKDRARAQRLEVDLHHAFAARCTRGEWFWFDMAANDDKALFHNTTRKLFLEHTGDPLIWQRISRAQVTAYVDAKVSLRRSA